MADTQATEIVDAEVVDDDTPVPPAAPAPQSVALARRERRSEVMHPLDVNQLVQSFEEYQQLLPRLLSDSDYQDAGIDNRTGKSRRFVKKSGWRKIATAFDLDVVLISDEVERDADGRVVRAKVIARAIAPSGRTMDGDGYCAADESRFTSGRGDQSKLENDLRGTATTRAKNRAISDLVGMGDVSAEEVSDGPSQQGPKYGLPVDDAVKGNASRALTKLCGGDLDVAEQTWEAIKGHMDGYMPQAAALTILKLASVVQLGLAETDPVFVDDRGDIPSEDEVAAEVAGLEDRALELWGQLVQPRTATKKVNEAGGNPQVLRALIASAEQAIAQRDEQAVTA